MGGRDERVVDWSVAGSLTILGNDGYCAWMRYFKTEVPFLAEFYRVFGMVTAVGVLMSEFEIATFEVQIGKWFGM